MIQRYFFTLLVFVSANICHANQYCSDQEVIPYNDVVKGTLSFFHHPSYVPTFGDPTNHDPSKAETTPITIEITKNNHLDRVLEIKTNGERVFQRINIDRQENLPDIGRIDSFGLMAYETEEQDDGLAIESRYLVSLFNIGKKVFKKNIFFIEEAEAVHIFKFLGGPETGTRLRFIKTITTNEPIRSLNVESTQVNGFQGVPNGIKVVLPTLVIRSEVETVKYDLESDVILLTKP